MWVITDARHNSTANAYHTTVPCLSGRFDKTQLHVFMYTVHLALIKLLGSLLLLEYTTDSRIGLYMYKSGFTTSHCPWLVLN